MKKWIGIAALMFTAITQASPELGKLHYLTEEYKPYNFSNEAGAPTGLAVELLHQVWQKTNTPPQTITIMPWARGYYLLTQKPNVVLFSTARTEARDPLFKWACPIGYAEIVLMGLAKNPLPLTKLEDAQQYNIGAVRADVGEQLLLNNGFDEQKIMTANRLPQALKMLTSGRVDLISTNKTTLMDLIATQQLDPAQFKVAWMLSSEQFCFAFSHPVSDELVKEFQNGLTQVLASSEFQQIQGKYFPAR
ncbi:MULTISPECIES: substrate-binding periplasmic protein [Aeromonas]|uniref:substrate-binding periplasmic protein n=1 Tax=Aeromonas TaxID=642 RepID=UPI0021F83C2B|nr:MULTISPECIES: transporter substrate-binding domain-containing protein [Aeromonas]MCW0503851.1 transporter substrate-binding domain-containing protein [Aeromonas piscicola]MCX7132078.1 transporter substrate-binding domain-containing protein [Aeromonas sp.]